MCWCACVWLRVCPSELSSSAGVPFPLSSGTALVKPLSNHMDKKGKHSAGFFSLFCHTCWFSEERKKNPYETLRTLLLQSSILGYLPSFVCFSRFPGWLLKLPEFSKDRRALHFPCWDASFFHTGTVWFKLVPLLLVLILKNGCNKSLWYEASDKVAGIKTRDLKCSLFSKIGLEVTECIWVWQTFSVKGKIVNIWAFGAVQPCTSTEWRWRSSPGQWWRAGCVPVKTDKNRQWAGLGLQAIACQLPAQRSGK